MANKMAGDAIVVEWDLVGKALVAGNSEEEDLPAGILEAGILEAGDSAAADLARRDSVARAMTDSAARASAATAAIVPPSADLVADPTALLTGRKMRADAANGRRSALAEAMAGQALIDPKPVAQTALRRAMTPARGAGRIVAAPIRDRLAAIVTARDQTAADQNPAVANSADRATAIGATHTARRISSSRCCSETGLLVRFEDLLPEAANVSLGLDP
jgi:hypothetical protein